MKDKWSFLAGIFEGEGCISMAERNQLRKNGMDRQHGTTCQIIVANTSLALMKWLIRNFGGVYYTKTYSNPNHRVNYIWHLNGAKNKERILLGMLPYLLDKRKQALVALEYIRMNGESNPEKRMELVARCKALKREESVETNIVGPWPYFGDVKIESELAGNCESAHEVTHVA